MAEPAPEIPLGEPIEPPFPTYVLEAYLILAGEVAGTPQQSPTADDIGTAGTSSSGILVVPHGALGDVESDFLIDDPMLSNESLLLFQNTFKDLYMFSTVRPLPYSNLCC